MAVITVGCFFFASVGSAKPDYTRRTNKECEFCHPPNSRQLTEAGKYYQEHKNSLAGFKPSEQSKDKSTPPPRK